MRLFAVLALLAWYFLTTLVMAGITFAVLTLFRTGIEFQLVWAVIAALLSIPLVLRIVVLLAFGAVHR